MSDPEGELYYYTIGAIGRTVAKRGVAPEEERATAVQFRTKAPPGSKGHVLFVSENNGEQVSRWFDDWDSASREALQTINAGGWGMFSHVSLTLEE